MVGGRLVLDWVALEPIEGAPSAASGSGQWIFWLAVLDGSAHRTLETDAEQFLRLHGELHRQLIKNLFAEAVDDH